MKELKKITSFTIKETTINGQNIGIGMETAAAEALVYGHNDLVESVQELQELAKQVRYEIPAGALSGEYELKVAVAEAACERYSKPRYTIAELREKWTQYEEKQSRISHPGGDISPYFGPRFIDWLDNHPEK